jgi:hypothetical protein
MTDVPALVTSTPWMTTPTLPVPTAEQRRVVSSLQLLIREKLTDPLIEVDMEASGVDR